jgi:putative ATP-dependent endonuclease of OLD family
MHPNTAFLGNDESIENRALDLLEKLKSNKDKSEFAQELCFELERRLPVYKDRFTIPDYIERSIKWVIDKE